MWFRKVRAFTLIEILVVISIIAMLMSILMPSLMHSREQAKRTVCMANLRSIGQSLYIYANNNQGRFVPGDFPVSWSVWSKIASDLDARGRPVNLGHLLASDTLPMPTNEKHVFFCPSRLATDRKKDCDSFTLAWDSDDFQAYINYMFNHALDGFGCYVEDGRRAVLSHRDKINFLQGDGSVHTFNAEPLVFDEAVGLELLQEVTNRYGVCFPAIMLHRWLEADEVDLDEAREYLNDPLGWFQTNCTESESRPIHLASVGKRSLVCDVVGFMSGTPPSG